MKLQRAKRFVRPFIESRRYVGTAQQYRAAIRAIRKAGFDASVWMPNREATAEDLKNRVFA